MATVKTDLESAYLSTVAYGAISTSMNNDVNSYINELTNTNGDIEMSVEEAKAFAGATEQRDDKTGEIIKDNNGNIQYKFETTDKLDSNGNIVINPETGKPEQVKTSGYTILSTSQEMGIDDGGFKAMFFKDNETGVISYNIAGTNDLSDIWQDIKLMATGNAVEQQIATQKYYDEMLATNPEITATTKIDVNGHSLGGFDAQIFTANNADIINHTTTFNAPGIEGLDADQLQLVGLAPENIPNDKITNIATSGWFSIVEDLGINIGSIDIEVAGWTHFLGEIKEFLTNANEAGWSIEQYNEYLQNNPVTIGEDNRVTVELDNFEMAKNFQNYLSSLPEDSQVEFIETEQIFKVTESTNLTILNAIEEIPEVSFLLSNVDLQIGDRLDLGSNGIYTVESGDTLSEIANNNGYSTKELLQKNTWLIDEDRVIFNQNKVLVSTDSSDLTEQNHTLIGDIDAENILIDSNDGEDTLVGGDKADTMKGGDGFDTYIAGLGDEITDSDGDGNIKLDNVDISGRKTKLPNTDMYEDETYVYEEINGSLVVTKKQGGGSLTINEWSNEELGINLSENNNIEINISDASALSSEGAMTFVVTLSRPLDDGEELSVNVLEETLIFKSGEQTKTVTYTITDNVSKTFTIAPEGTYNGLDNVNITTNQGTGTVIQVSDDDKRYDPLALDINKDGFISTSSLEDSTTYFDITGDGIREKVGWIKDEDALLAYDKNENNQIDGINEVFGNLNESGFAELKRLVDSNHDNVINRRDELFARLQIWNDTNQDAKAGEDELQSLSEAGIKEIDLNIVETNIEINGNLLSEASKYIDDEGNKELAADIQLATDAKDTKVEFEDIPNFSIENYYKLNLNSLTIEALSSCTIDEKVA